VSDIDKYPNFDARLPFHRHRGGGRRYSDCQGGAVRDQYDAGNFNGEGLHERRFRKAKNRKEERRITLKCFLLRSVYHESRHASHRKY